MLNLCLDASFTVLLLAQIFIVFSTSFSTIIVSGLTGCGCKDLPFSLIWMIGEADVGFFLFFLKLMFLFNSNQWPWGVGLKHKI